MSMNRLPEDAKVYELGHYEAWQIELALRILAEEMGPNRSLTGADEQGLNLEDAESCSDCLNLVEDADLIDQPDGSRVCPDCADENGNAYTDDDFDPSGPEYYN